MVDVHEIAVEALPAVTGGRVLAHREDDLGQGNGGVVSVRMGLGEALRCHQMKIEKLKK